METIKATLESVMQVLETKKKALSGEDPRVLLEQALSKKELRHIKFNDLKKGILSISVDSSAWLYHLSLKKENLLLKLGKKSAGIRGIRFRLGGRK